MLDTLDVKSRVLAYDLSSSLAAALGRLVGGTTSPRHGEKTLDQPFHAECATAWRRSGQPLPPVEVLQAAACK